MAPMKIMATVEMSINMDEFVKMVQEQSKDRNGNVQYVFCAGYYDSFLRQLEISVPGVREYVRDRVEIMNRYSPLTRSAA
jgi:hypothetical protein